MDYLADALIAIGLAALTTGVGMAFGLAYAFIVLGSVLLAIGMAAAWRRST